MAHSKIGVQFTEFVMLECHFENFISLLDDRKNVKPVRGPLLGSKATPRLLKGQPFFVTLSL